MSEPLSDDAELAELEYRLQQEVERHAAGLEPPFVSAKLALRLVAEVRRLRALAQDLQRDAEPLTREATKRRLTGDEGTARELEGAVRILLSVAEQIRSPEGVANARHR